MDEFPMEFLELYRYSRLRAPTNIRLIRLLPATSENDDQLSIELLEYDFPTANGIYTALSYACGDTSVELRLPVVFWRLQDNDLSDIIFCFA